MCTFVIAYFISINSGKFLYKESNQTKRSTVGVIKGLINPKDNISVTDLKVYEFKPFKCNERPYAPAISQWTLKVNYSHIKESIE